MKREDWRDLRTFEIIVLGLSLAWSTMVVVSTRASYLPNGSSKGGDGLFIVGVLIFLLSLALGATGVLLIGFNRSRKVGLGLLCFSLTFIACFIASGRICGHIRHQALVRFTERSKPLIAAIKAYQSEHGAPPPELKSLVPKYLKEVPGSGMGVYPKLEYVSGAKARERFEGNPWAFRLWTPETLMDFDNMIYLPNRNYKTYRLTRTGMIGDWQYLDD